MVYAPNAEPTATEIANQISVEILPRGSIYQSRPPGTDETGQKGEKMIIKLGTVVSKDKVTARIAEVKAKMESSTYNEMATGQYGQSRVHEGELQLMAYQNKIKQLEDIRNNTPAVPTITIMVYQSYNERDMLKDNGFKFDGSDKYWYKNVPVENLDEELMRIGAK